MTPDEIRKHNESPITKVYPTGKKMIATKMTQQQQNLYSHGWSAIRLRFSIISLHDKNDLIEIWQVENGKEILIDK